MQIGWVRGFEEMKFNRPSTFFIQGVRGSGKSSLLETIGTQYLEANSCLLDLFGSRDGEGLAWLRSPYAENRKILLLHGDAVIVDSNYNSKPASKLMLDDFEKFDIIISASPLYSSPDDEFTNAGQITDRLYKRLHWDRVVYGVVREASNLFYSRLRISDNQIIAKSQMTYLIREARHMGLALGLDSLRYMAIDIDVRTLADFMFLKSQGLEGLSSDLHWLYSVFKPSIIQKMPPQNFVVIAKTGAIGLGQYDELPWHKKEHEDLLKILKIGISYGVEEFKGVDRGRYKTIGDAEHAELIRIYVEEGIGMNKLALRLKRSARTVMDQINEHDEAVVRSTSCPECERAKAPYSKQIAKRYSNPHVEEYMQQRANHDQR